MSTVPCPHRVAARTPGDNATVAPHGDAPVSDVQEGDDFWTLKSFAYNLEDMSLSTSEDDSVTSRKTSTSATLSKKATGHHMEKVAAMKRLAAKMSKNVAKKKDEGKRFKKRYQLSKEQYKEYEEIFAMFDTDSDGLISVPDLRIALKNMGMTPTKREIFDMIRQGDIKKKGCIDFPGFMTLLKRKIMVDMDAELAELFSVFDINTDGVICVDDIAKVHAMSGDDIDKRSIDEMIKEADTNNDGVIDFEEFKEVLMKNSINNFLKF